ncbi:hypothetical protein [Phytohabitans suffuscus]|nr:hypothetical protein [Phytohabitans suffuscus]
MFVTTRVDEQEPWMNEQIAPVTGAGDEVAALVARTSGRRSR